VSIIAVQRKENNKAVQAATPRTSEPQQQQSAESGTMAGVPLYLGGGRQSGATAAPPASLESLPNIQPQIEPEKREEDALAQHLHANVDIKRQSRENGAGLVRAKLSVGVPDDSYERQADAVADRVMRTETRCSDACSESTKVAVQPLSGEEMPLQKEVEQPIPQGDRQHTSGKFASGVNALCGGGSMLPAATRAWLESRMGSDFSAVRVHHGPAAAALNRAIAARAFTFGSDIFFAPGQYRPESDHGRRLLAHELTHVIQQRGGQRSTESGPVLTTQRKVQRAGLQDELDKELADWARGKHKTTDSKHKDYGFDLQEYAWTLINNPNPDEYGPLPEPKAKKERKTWEKKFRKAGLLAQMILAGGPAVEQKETRAGMILNFMAQAGFSAEAVKGAGSMTDKDEIASVYSGVLDRISKADPGVLSTITQFFIVEKGQSNNPILEKFSSSDGTFEKSLSNNQMTALLKPLIAAYAKEAFLVNLVAEALLRKKGYRNVFSDWMWREGKGGFLFQVLESKYFIEPEYGPTVVADVGELKLEGDMDWVYANKQKYYVGFLVQLGKDGGVKIDAPGDLKFATIKTWLDVNTANIGAALAKKYPDEPDRWVKVYEQLADIFFYHVSGRDVHPDLGGKLGKLEAGAPAKMRLKADCDVFSTYAMRFFATVKDPANPKIKAFEPVGYMALDPKGNEGHSVALMRRDGSYYVINNKEVTALALMEAKKDEQKEMAIKGMRDDALQIYETKPDEYKVYYADALAAGAMPKALANTEPATRRKDLEP